MLPLICATAMRLAATPSGSDMLVRMNRYCDSGGFHKLTTSNPFSTCENGMDDTERKVQEYVRLRSWQQSARSEGATTAGGKADPFVVNSPHGVPFLGPRVQLSRT
jgi:hypothetical protein